MAHRHCTDRIGDTGGNRLVALLFFNLTFIALGNSYIPTEELLDKEEENQRSGEENQRNEEEKHL